MRVMDFRAILFHKQSTSARLRFLRFSYNSVCALEPLPRLSQAHARKGNNRVLVHPRQVLQRIEVELGFSQGVLQLEEGYHFVVAVPNGEVQIVLISIETVDPPFALAQTIAAEFIDLTQARALPEVELELLRGAYELVLGG